MSSFIDACASGAARAEAIDDEVEAWHNGASGLPLHAYLGMTQDEYDEWLADPTALSRFIESRRRGSRVG
jgi:hypothetical protein